MAPRGGGRSSIGAGLPGLVSSLVDQPMGIDVDSDKNWTEYRTPVSAEGI
jgi:hypothetical protein